jgi:hypothetical protein
MNTWRFASLKKIKDTMQERSVCGGRGDDGVIVKGGGIYNFNNDD